VTQSRNLAIVQFDEQAVVLEFLDVAVDYLTLLKSRRVSRESLLVVLDLVRKDISILRFSLSTLSPASVVSPTSRESTLPEDLAFDELIRLESGFPFFHVLSGRLLSAWGNASLS
jgi:hypothetical protein